MVAPHVGSEVQKDGSQSCNYCRLISPSNWFQLVLCFLLKIKLLLNLRVLYLLHVYIGKFDSVH